MHGVIYQLLPRLAQELAITRPLAAFDLETTGVNTEQDRIVQVTIARVLPATYQVTIYESLVNPQRPIPKEASDVHGITDAMVREAPTFQKVQPVVAELVIGSDLVGYNHRRFDVRMLASEFKRCNQPDPCGGARLLDVCRIFHTREPRDLTGAMRFYCNEDHADAHGTTPDVAATLKVLVAQLQRYTDLSRDLDELDALNRDPSWIDKDGKLAWRNGEACLNFGKHQGIALKVCDRSYLEWVTRQDWCPPDVLTILRDALRNRYPVAPPTLAGVA